MSRRALAVAVAIAPTIAFADPAPAPLAVTPSYAPRGHPPFHLPGAQPAADSFGYFYVAFFQELVMAGAGASMVQAEPKVATIDYHSLAEIAVESSDNKQIIEIGWTVDPGVNAADTAPHLFSFHWIDGVPTCYNGCGWVQVSATHMPGMAVEPGPTPHTFQIEHRADARWWLTYDGDDMGYYPDTEWQGRYTHGDFTQWFGEVAAGTEPMPCTQMGTGVFGSAAGAASYADVYTVGSGSEHLPAQLQQATVTLPTAYGPGQASATGFSFGGPGVPAASCVYDGAAVADDPVGADATVVMMPDEAGGGCCEADGGGAGGALVGAGLVGLALRRRPNRAPIGRRCRRGVSPGRPRR